MNLHLESVCKSYGPVRALEDVTLSLPEEPIALLGPNGAGKSTLLQILSKQIRPDSGEIFYGKVHWKQQADVKKMIGYLPQKFGFYPYLTVEDSLTYLAHMKGIQAHKVRNCVNEMMEKTNLTGCRSQRIHALSGGTLRRVGIAQALMGEPKIFLIDEPTAGLDAEEQIRFRMLVAANTRGHLSIISTHMAEDIASICSYVVLLKKGRVLYQGKSKALIENAIGWIGEESIDVDDYKEFERCNPVLRIRQREEQKIVVRYALPQKSRSFVEPTVEDAYMLMLKRAENV